MKMSPKLTTLWPQISRLLLHRPSVLASFRSQLAAMGTLFILLAYLLIPYETKAYILHQPAITSCNLGDVDTWASCSVEDHERQKIPNILHFVHVLSDSSADFSFQFSHLLSMYGAWHAWKPDKIYLHTNVDVDSPPIIRAKQGLSGKWAKLIFDLPGFTVHTVTAPTHARNGHEIVHVEHRSVFVRVQAVHDFGGVYIDTDVHALRDVGVLRRLGYGAVGGRQVGGELNSGTFMAERGSKMTRLWIERMHRVYDGGWTTHSNSALTRVAEQLQRDEPCEMLIMGRDAMAPGGWTSGYTSELFTVHDEDGASIVDAKANQTDLGSLPGPPDETTLGNDVDEAPTWALDWPCTFLLHAFSPKKQRNKVRNNGITPRYVLERSSNFARAVFPVAKELYDRGLISPDDMDIDLDERSV